MFIFRLLRIERSVAGANFPASTFTVQTGLATRKLTRMLDSLVRVSRRGEWNHVITEQHSNKLGRHVHQSWDRPPSAYGCPRSACWHWLTGQETLHTSCSRPTATLLEAVGKHTRVQQSHRITLVSFTSLSASSDTVTSLYRVLFHLSLMVLVCYWSQTYVQL